MAATTGGDDEGRPLLDRLADWTVAEKGPSFAVAFVLAAFVLATVARLALDPLLPDGFPFVTYFAAVAATAFCAGVRAGAVQVLLGLLGSWYLFLPPRYSFALEAGGALALGLFLFVVGIELALVLLMRRALRRLALAEGQARELARARSLMFQELQHRVSNNLAVVASLLQVQRREVMDPQARAALDAAVARVGVVARLNRLLHDPGAQSVDAGAFLRAVVPEAVAASGAAERVQVALSAEDLALPAERAVTLGLVANELIANAIEHGFPDGRRGHLEVSFRRSGPAQACLRIRDDGAGLPEDFDLGQARSLGLTIARQFAGQLDGALTLGRDGGTLARLDLPLGP